MSLQARTEHARQDLPRAFAAHLSVEPDRLSLLHPPKPTADNAVKLLLRDPRGAAEAVVLCSGHTERNLVEEGVALAAQARQLLGAILGSVILEPIRTGRIDANAYAVYPYRRPLSDHRWLRRAQLLYLRPRLLHWLREATAATIDHPTGDEIERLFRAPLQHLVEQDDLNPTIRRQGEQALGRLVRGQWQPKLVLVHNDLWTGNILLKPWSRPAGDRYPFVIIDWPGARIRGHAIYDLVRLAHSLRLTTRSLRREVHAHCRLLGCSGGDAAGYLLAALGAIDLDRGEFQRPQFVELAERSCARLFNLLEVQAHA